MTENNRELKPCPFCGGEAALMKDEPDNRYCDEYRIMCFSGECGVAPDHVFENKHEAVKAWNTRTPDTSTKQALTEAKSALEFYADENNYWRMSDGGKCQEMTYNTSLAKATLLKIAEIEKGGAAKRRG